MVLILRQDLASLSLAAAPQYLKIFPALISTDLRRFRALLYPPHSAKSMLVVSLYYQGLLVCSKIMQRHWNYGKGRQI
jgi:hypothetical protein